MPPPCPIVEPFAPLGLNLYAPGFFRLPRHSQQFLYNVCVYINICILCKNSGRNKNISFYFTIHTVNYSTKLGILCSTVHKKISSQYFKQHYVQCLVTGIIQTITPLYRNILQKYFSEPCIGKYVKGPDSSIQFFERNNFPSNSL